ncbi:GNAT family N-acetyltransferase [Paracoccus pacificus]|uniref:GNAT family N-acetyltransferase n=1 Tax=Paracoccus pacificus TaxID=1463598 RepID=A0ABW4RC69_9RHOB
METQTGDGTRHGAERPVGRSIAGWTAVPRPGPDRLDGRYVSLERLNAARHAGDIFAANMGQDWVWDYLGYGPFARVEEYAAWLDGMAQSQDPFFYALIDKAGAKTGGVASYLRIEPGHGVIEIGHIEIAPFLQRTRAASEAIMLMVRWAFENGYRRVEWKCDALNAPSRRAAERYGFAFEGVFRNHMIIKGRNRDTAWFAMTSEDWPAIRAEWDRWLDPSNFDDTGRQLTPLRVSSGA